MPSSHPIRRALYVSVGLVFVGLAVAGAILPVLPTTPFLLLASYCFVRSSPRLHAWLMNSKSFGPLLRDWHAHRAVRPRVKVTAISVMFLCGGGSAAFTFDRPLVLAVLAGLLLVGLIVVLRLPVIRDEVPPLPAPQDGVTMAP